MAGQQEIHFIGHQSGQGGDELANISQDLIGIREDVFHGAAGKDHVPGKEQALVVVIKTDIALGVAGGRDHLQQMRPHLNPFASPEHHHLVQAAGLFHDLHERHGVEVDIGQGVQVGIDFRITSIKELPHAPHMVEMAVGQKEVLQEGDIELLAQLMQHPVRVAGIDEGAAFVQDVNIAAHARFFDPPDAFQPGVIFGQMDHCSSYRDGLSLAGTDRG
jgi:hypothetical protein